MYSEDFAFKCRTTEVQFRAKERAVEPYQQLEKEWATFNALDPEGMVACSSGTAALHLALEAMKLPPGSEVITGDFNMIAVPRAISMAGLTPVFVDCDERLLMAPQLIPEDAKVIMAVHIYGRRCKLESIKWLVKYKDEGYLIEDLAEAHGVKPSHLTDAACWSFYKNKIVAGEEGGAVWFRDKSHAALARQLRSLGFTDAHNFNHVPRGCNYRMSNLHADWILSNVVYGRGNFNGLPHYLTNLKRRRQIERWYDELCPVEWRMPSRDAPWVYDLRIRGITSEQQNDIVTTLNKARIAARHAFKPMHVQAEFSKCKAIGPERQWGACMAAKEVFYLPIQPGITTRKQCEQSFALLRNLLHETK